MESEGYLAACRRRRLVDVWRRRGVDEDGTSVKMGKSGVVVVGIIPGNKWRYMGWAFECLGLQVSFSFSFSFLFDFLGNGSTDQSRGSKKTDQSKGYLKRRSNGSRVL